MLAAKELLALRHMNNTAELGLWQVREVTMLGKGGALEDISMTQVEYLNKYSIGLETCMRGHGLSAEPGWQ